MTETIPEERQLGLTPEAIREQLDRLVADAAFRSSRRSVQFLRFVVEETLNGSAEQIKERTIGIRVFGRDPSYDTNLDHVVRTAAIELRKRLAIYYGQEEHRNELRMSLVPGSYVPHFSPPPNTEGRGTDREHDLHTLGISSLAAPAPPPHVGQTRTEQAAHAPEPQARKSSLTGWLLLAGAALIVAAALFFWWGHPANSQDVFWKPLLDTPGPVLMAVGDVPNGPPTTIGGDPGDGIDVPVIHKTSSPVVPFADTVTIARIWGILASHGKRINIRREGASSFSDLREGPVVLVGAFNNEWSLRFSQKLRYSLALDTDRHLIYIRDAKHPEARVWSWQTNQPTTTTNPTGHTTLQDYALISRIWNSETGHVVVSVGGLYTYGTEAAGEFLSDPQMMQDLARLVPEDPHKNLQIVLGATVTDGTPGPPKVLAVASF